MFACAGVVDEGSWLLPDDPHPALALDPDGGSGWVLWEWPDDPHAEDWWVADALAELDGFAAAATVAGPAGAGLVDAMQGGNEPIDLPLPGEALADDVAADDGVGGQASTLWESAVCLEQLVPGAGLAQVLEVLDPAALSDAALVEAVAAAERLAAWAHLQAALLAGVLSRRPAMNPRWQAPVPTRACVAGDELAMRLGWSRPAAARLVRDGQALGNELLLVADAVREGLVDTSKLRVLTDRLADRPDQLAWAVQEIVLPEAATRTPTQLAADIDRALLAVAPEDAARRLPRAVAARHVCHPRRLPDGMAGLWAVLPALDAARIDGTLEATARAARALGDPRTLDQLRADILTDLATGDALLAGAAMRDTTTAADPSCTPSATRRRAADGDAFDAVVTRFDAARAEARRRDAANADLSGAAAAGVRREATIQDRDDWRATEDGAGGRGDPDDPPGHDGTAGEEMRPPGRAAPGIRIPKIRIDVTVALSTLVGLDEQPGELAGLGPIPAEQARALAAGGTWRRIVTDPLTGAVLDVGRTRYRPPAALADHVLARDGQCAGPGCSVPGHRCDLDHTTEYHATPANGSPQQGTTSAANLGPLSDRCHRLKTDGGFTLHQIAPGVFEWHTPAGLAYHVTPGQHGHTKRLDTHTHTSYPNEPPF